MKNITKQMMRVAIVGMMSLPSFSALADVVYTGKIEHSPNFLPKQFISDGKSELYNDEGMGESEMQSYNKFTIYDGKFAELSSFTTPIYPSVSTNNGYKRQPIPMSFSILSNERTYADQTYMLTQTLFNNDVEFEWIIEKYKVVTVENGVDGNQDVAVCGFKVMSQNGATVVDIDFPTCLNWSDFDVYMTSDGPYLSVYGESIDDDSYYSLIYKIDPNSSSIQAVGAPRKVSVSPTAPRRGTPVNVSLGEPVGNNCKLSVVSASGRTAIVQNLKPGDSEAVIDTNRLGNGVYVVVVDNGKTKREATKIVVR